ncbi:nucleotidyltransferase domain-containing protein [Micromonospora cathayae]|uniref:Nucleotidyltransferase domain-containing protein n=1 Tax=Micromonospora cathayae TaxID=3028804 RepID=A0ABY7ZI52_9ACTN|nr:nucleotidyltransferase domain-containing protein [Micromonospora sp. HUAS 3]WDZ82456.1 nucleotidyltransferase domain-containing protein [Micromonospora sp. HUAS 3]
MDPDVRHYLRQLVDVARDVLGGNLVGGYAAGSVALDAYQPGRSDIDVALLCAQAPGSARGRELVARLRHEALPCPARGLELVLYRTAVARSGTPEPGFDLELNTGPGLPFRASVAGHDRPAADGLFWYGLDRSILHQHGQTLFGPPAAEAFTDPAPADLRRLLVDALRWWLARPQPDGTGPAPGAGDAVLGACRSLVRFRDGEWLPKVGAGRRLLRTGWPAEVIERSIAARSGGTPPDGAQARAFQRRVLAEIGGPGGRSGDDDPAGPGPYAVPS